ncbi:uncharacterized protein J3D65DRAFT_409102 [Phyllosticta citribraziliensis]|uniref:Uncharacterized protein n=1 Tax=Phyllosticta citribraziliensis TaxID=989973 RepID=A0ABR1LM21_9PEZI
MLLSLPSSTTSPQHHPEMATPPDMTLRLPPHIQKQLADMACSPPPRTRSDAPANSQYHTALAIQYRQRIQGIIKADLSAFITADDVTHEEPEPSPLPSKRHDSPSAELEDLLPPYSEEDPDVNTAACTITVKELSSMDTPTPTPTSTDDDNRFFALVTTTTHETMPTRPHTDMITRITSHFSTSSTSSEDSDAIQPAAALNDHPAPLHRYSSFAPPKLLRAAALDTKPRDPCKTKHSHPPSCPRTSPSKVRRIVERFTAKKDDTAAKDKRRRARQAVV